MKIKITNHGRHAKTIEVDDDEIISLIKKILKVATKEDES